MESKLLSGKGAILQAGSSMVDHTNEQQKMLEKVPFIYYVSTWIAKNLI